MTRCVKNPISLSCLSHVPQLLSLRKPEKSRASDDSDGRTGGGSFDRVKSWSFRSRSRGSIGEPCRADCPWGYAMPRMGKTRLEKFARACATAACNAQRFRRQSSAIVAPRDSTNLFLFCFEQKQSLVGPPRDFTRNTLPPSHDSFFSFFETAFASL